MAFIVDSPATYSLREKEPPEVRWAKRAEAHRKAQRSRYRSLKLHQKERQSVVLEINMDVRDAVDAMSSPDN